jgi:DNA modification methylase
MHAPSAKFPTQAQLVFPLLAVANESGGRVRSADAYRSLAVDHGLSESAVDEVVRVPCGQVHNLWERHVRFAKERAKAKGYMVSAAPGLWQLTDEGQEAVRKARSAVRVVLLLDHSEQPIGANVELAMEIPTVHSLVHGDARDLHWINDNEIPLILTSVPYFDLKEYEHEAGQLADIRSYDEFLAGMTDALREAYRVAMPGARMAISVGDVLRSRAKHGAHEILPLSSDIIVNCRRIGFQSLTGIIWKKYQNCRYEQGGGGVLGTPDQPRRVIKSESERILLFKKPGEYFSATPEQREASRISKEDQKKYWREIWDDIPGARASSDHPAPFPVELAYRLIRMFSFTGPLPQTVLDMFSGSATTAIAAMRAGRSSICVDVARQYVTHGIERVRAEADRLSGAAAFA